MDDLIRRQDVIDIIMGDGLYCDTYDDKEYSAERIKSIPTVDLSEYCDKLWKTAYERGIRNAQTATEIIHCKECVYYENDNSGLCYLGGSWDPDDYCSNGRRRVYG